MGSVLHPLLDAEVEKDKAPHAIHYELHHVMQNEIHNVLQIAIFGDIVKLQSVIHIALHDD
jgi:hypothetical protein